jgi:hypothetical protein
MFTFRLILRAPLAVTVAVAIAPSVSLAQELPPELCLEQPWQTGWACGLNSLYFLLTLSGKYVEFEDLHRQLSPPEGGNSLEELMATARNHGLDLVALRTSRRGLREVRVPFIAHLHAPPGDGGHFLVVLRMSDDAYDIIDGTQATVRKLNPEVFHQFWSGYVLATGTTRWESFAKSTAWIVLSLAGLAVCLRAGRALRSRFGKPAPSAGLCDHSP